MLATLSRWRPRVQIPSGPHTDGPDPLGIRAVRRLDGPPGRGYLWHRGKLGAGVGVADGAETCDEGAAARPSGRRRGPRPSDPPLRRLPSAAAAGDGPRRYCRCSGCCRRCRRCRRCRCSRRGRGASGGPRRALRAQLPSEQPSLPYGRNRGNHGACEGSHTIGTAGGGTDGCPTDRQFNMCNGTTVRACAALCGLRTDRGCPNRFRSGPGGAPAGAGRPPGRPGPGHAKDRVGPGGIRRDLESTTLMGTGPGSARAGAGWGTRNHPICRVFSSRCAAGGYPPAGHEPPPRGSGGGHRACGWT